MTKHQRFQWRRLLQFQLRTLLVFMVFFGVLLGLWFRHNNHYRKQTVALETLQPFVKAISSEPGRPRWASLFSNKNQYRDVTRLIFHGSPNSYKLKDSHFKSLVSMPRLQRLSLHRVPIGDETMKYVAYHQELDTLSLQFTRVTDEGLKYIATLPNLTELQLAGTKVLGPGLKHLLELDYLENLDLSGLPITDEHLKLIGQIRSLRWLKLENTKIGGDGLRHLMNLPYLERLTVSSPNIKDVELSGAKSLKGLSIRCYSSTTTKPQNVILKDMPRLTTLDLHVAKIRRMQIAKIPLLNTIRLHNSKVREVEGLQALRHLTFVDMGYCGISNQTVQKLAGLTMLEEVHVPGSAIEDDDLRYFKDLKRLRVLNLGSTKIKGHGLEWLTDLPVLEKLFLSSSTIGDAAGYALGKMKSLEHLTLRQTNIGDAGLSQMRGVDLKTLDLVATKVTDVSIPDLAAMKVKQFWLQDTMISRKGFQQLRSKLPKATAYWSQRRVRGGARVQFDLSSRQGSRRNKRRDASAREK